MQLKTRILLLVGLLLSVAVLIQFVAGRLTLAEADHRLEASVLNGKAVLWEEIVSRQLEVTAERSTNITRPRAYKNALRGRTVEGLQEQLYSTGFSHLRSMELVHQAYIVRPDRSILVAAEETELSHVATPWLDEVLREKTMITTLASNEAGEIVYYTLFPIFRRAQVIGIGVYETQLQPTINQFSEREGSQVLILDRTGVPVASTGQSRALWGQLNLATPELGARQVWSAEVDGQTYQVTSFPLVDQAQNPLGHFVTLRDLTASYDLQHRYEWGAALVTVLVIVVALLWVRTSLGRMLQPLQEVRGFLSAVAEGDLTQQIRVRGQDEIVGAANQMSERLRETVSTIAQTADELTRAAQGVTSVSQTSAADIERQRSETEEISAAIVRVDGEIQAVASRAGEVHQASAAANQQTQQGQQEVEQGIAAMRELARVVEGAVTTIQRLGQESEAIGSILDVIRGIAEQTNLLALNAAIEAARAGEHGRGFSVVADEVRTLAGRTQESTQQIHAMIGQLQEGAREAVSVIETSQEQAELSVTQAEQSISSLAAINTAVSNITSLAEEINRAVEQQAAATAEVSRNVSEVTQIAGRTAQGTDASLSAVSEMSTLVTRLRSLAGQFKV